jgi:hypothetical protein
MAVKKLDMTKLDVNEHDLPDARRSVTMKPDPTRIDPRKLKLGKQIARHDPRTLLLAS